MLNNNFVWTDLSTFNVERAKSFYSSVFGWDYKSTDSSYYIARLNTEDISGLYLMPEKFQKIKLPSFWMSYIKVSNLDSAIEIANKEGGKIELIEKENEIGKVALIRDPLGAGFTIYEGEYLDARSHSLTSSYCRSELVVSDISKVKVFYEKIFDWTFVEISKTQHKIYNSPTSFIADIIEVPNSIKGKDEYWGVYFFSSYLQQSKQQVINNGGSIIFESKRAIICNDPFGAAFNITDQL